ncbi:uncharacterized protein GGS25DRAFT_523242 [Hypoxylon fragiforme]|uniref:uncharacterized protein n=1 Tax=Hypoxylon fragiforme TaxID=63214 RepID=UPI0020C63FA9|nr:uncharacterized protein GGS25DRAFT_523242 [Hypoxylon fragiforme]KAI2607717.1 hypothetical protein GGS25DRAFT_523242 [Hypoxylon fragiforme]
MSRSYNRISVYDARPFHAYLSSDDGEGEDDDVDVWKDGPELFDLSDSEDDRLENYYRTLNQERIYGQGKGKGKGKSKAKIDESATVEPPPERPQPPPQEEEEEAEEVGSEVIEPAEIFDEDTKTVVDLRERAPREPSPPPPRQEEVEKVESEITEPAAEDSGEYAETVVYAGDRLTDAEFAQRQVSYALATTRRNLTRISQFMLKLECRAGKVTKESIRQTLDATVADNADAFFEHTFIDPVHIPEIEELKALSESTWHRLYLLDRVWRRQGRDPPDTNNNKDNTSSSNSSTPPPTIPLAGERSVKTWLREETRTARLASRDECYFTAADLAQGRRFADWIAYLRELCQFKDHPADEAKLVKLAWRFLDRNLRGPPPANPTRAGAFVARLESEHERGGFDEVLGDPGRQEGEDERAWRDIRKYWSSRFQY